MKVKLLLVSIMIVFTPLLAIVKSSERLPYQNETGVNTVAPQNQEDTICSIDETKKRLDAIKNKLCYIENKLKVYNETTIK